MAVPYRNPRLIIVDDDRGRYDELKRLLDDAPFKPELDIVTCPKCVSEALQGPANAVLLDYDLDGIGYCAKCGRDWCSEDRRAQPLNMPWGAKGSDWVEKLDPKLPVIVVSANRHGSKYIHKLLIDRQFWSVAVISALEVQSELRWLGQLWLWGCL